MCLLASPNKVKDPALRLGAISRRIIFLMLPSCLEKCCSVLTKQHAQLIMGLAFA